MNIVFRVNLDPSGTKVVFEVDQPGVNAVAVTLDPSDAHNLANTLANTAKDAMRNVSINTLADYARNKAKGEMP